MQLLLEEILKGHGGSYVQLEVYKLVSWLFDLRLEAWRSECCWLDDGKGMWKLGAG